MKRRYNLSNMLQKYLDSVLMNIHTIQPGKFITYYGHSQKKAKVQPLVKQKDTKNNIYEASPIDNVPVIFPCVANFELKFPIQKDDGCLLLFSELPIGNYLNYPGGLKQVEADDANKFELTDCIAIPGLYNFKNVPSPTTKIEINDNNTIIIETNLGKIEIDTSGNITFNDGTEAYVLGTTCKTELDKEAANMTALKAAINGWTPVPNDGGAALKIALTAFLALATENYSSILSTQIKGK